jgi:hypothetical protein
MPREEELWEWGSLAYCGSNDAEATWEANVTVLFADDDAAAAAALAVVDAMGGGRCWTLGLVYLSNRPGARST